MSLNASMSYCEVVDICGLVRAAIYHAVFRFAITTFNLTTPSREPEEEFEDLPKA
jgi:PTS system N-acetylglucosamine-specific IIC component